MRKLRVGLKNRTRVGENHMDKVGVYKDTTVNTQSKGRLIILLYEGAIKFMKLAVKELEAGNYLAKGQHINRAQDIINELNAVLDTDAGGEIAGNLRKLYFFMNNRLSEANIKRDPQMINQVIRIMEELSQGWKTIAG